MDWKAEERKRIKDEKREANRKAWAESQKLVKAKKPIGVSPKDDKKRIQEFKEQLLSAAVGTSVIRKVIDVARNDEHPGQMAALKMCLDRLLPVSLFEEKGALGSHGTQFTIVIGDSRPVDVIESEAKKIE